jgi:nucleotide-binding universal stress UspA family protein
MKKILVPVDFSLASRSASFYAAGIAEVLDASVTLLHVVNAESSEETLANWRTIEKKMLESSQRDALSLIKEIGASIKSKIVVDYHVVRGHPMYQHVEEFVKANAIDLVIMGTKGASGLKKMLMGSNTVAVINESSVPVITVPTETRFSPIKLIVYASDNMNLKYEIRKVALFAKIFHAQLHVLHVAPPEGEPVNINDLERGLIDTAHFSDIHVHIAGGGNVNAVVEGFVAEHKANLLVMFTEKMNHLKQAFGKSKTREFAFSGSIPMLALNKTAAEFAVMQGWEFDLNFK